MKQETINEIFTEALIDKAIEVGQRGEKLKFDVGILKARTRKLIAKQDQLRMGTGEEFILPKGAKEELEKRILELQREIGGINNDKILKEEEFNSLSGRLDLIEGMFTGEGMERN